ncbi:MULTISPECIES: dephospho-CoA kinase [unclassified Prochlorococcus]|uniref:dephospho-CoA kinase n=1 Tax=unclassified Prochlorococcus TaxID=2627481 RepID=UPI000533ABBD|nr:MULTISPECIES: dephospho-CoA kinase [unclassified Prochlorococcus]KGG16898.1 Dephospho-CoA kinase [Prochlorococcus sp. MIT 0602]KGG18127.1 Dephospho-CoA kinase [Prochlorococcus sp. MIT 0603]
MKVLKVTAENRWNGNQRRIGITGGIASGKSSVAKYLSNIKNIPILDADLFAREALTQKIEINQQIIKRYGLRIARETKFPQEINRLELGEIIFSDPKEKLWIESLIHPYVKRRFYDELKRYKSRPILALVIPLLFEANLTNICSEIWLIYCTISQQYERLNIRNNFNYEQSRCRIESQIAIDNKRDMSDKIIDNSKSIEFSYRQIDKLLE